MGRTFRRILFIVLAILVVGVMLAGAIIPAFNP